MVSSGRLTHTASYTFKLKAPTFTPNGGSFAAPIAVTVGNASNAGAVGVWTCATRDGSAPACGATPSTCAGTASS